MEIKDLVGLSQPLTKLIEVASNGLGNISKPYLIKKTADAKAYEIERIARAIEQSKDALKLIEYDNEKVKLVCESEGIPEDIINDFIAITERASQANLHKQIKRQINIENVLAGAADELKNEKQVPEEQLNDDWIDRFFNVAGDINSEEMQGLWSKILAGEIKRPNSYSLRTLDTLRNITPYEAEIFCKVGAFALSSGDKTFLMYEKDFIKEELGIAFTDLLLIRDLGLAFPNELKFSFLPVDKDEISHLIWGNTIIVLKRNDKTPEIPLTSVVFTQTGKELLTLVEKPLNNKYLDKVCLKLRINENIHTYYAHILGINNGVISHTDLIEIK